MEGPLLHSEAPSLLSSYTVEAHGGTSATELGSSLLKPSTPEAQGGTSATERGSFTTDILYSRGRAAREVWTGKVQIYSSFNNIKQYSPSLLTSSTPEAH